MQCFKKHLSLEMNFILIVIFLLTPVYTQAASDPTPTTITLTWTAPGDDGAVGNAAQYDIRYSISPITVDNLDSAVPVIGEPAPLSSGSSEEFTVTGLEPSTIYYFGIKTADEASNWSLLSNVISRTTADEATVPSPPLLVTPADGAVNLIQPIAFDWSDIANADSYQIQIADNSSIVNPIEDTVISNSAYSISNLNPGGTYYWRVRSHNAVGYGNWTAVNDFSTDCPIPAIPVLASPANGATNVNSPVLMDWDDVSSATEYQVQIDVNSSFSFPVINVTVSASQYSATGLDEEQTYFWRVRTKNSCGWSNYSEIRNLGTADQTPPAGIIDLSAVTGPNNGEIQIEWTATGDDNHLGTVVAYMIKYSREIIDDDNWDLADIYEEIIPPVSSGLKQFANVSGLEPGNNYHIGIKAYDENANGSPLSNIAACVSGIDLVLAYDDEISEQVSPGSGALLHSSKPLLVVSNVSSQGDNLYHFEVATDSFFINMAAVSPPIDQQLGGVTGWIVDQPLQSNQTYFWRARANNNNYCTTIDFLIQSSVHTYPNPFSFSSATEVAFTDIPEGADVVLTTVSGSTIQEWSDVTNDLLTWDGTNGSGGRVASGTYLWFVEGTDLQGKIIVMQ